MPAKPLQSTKPGRHFCSVSVDVAAAAALLKAIFWQSTRLDCGDVEREGGKEGSCRKIEEQCTT